jgi:predicted nucleotidyltransferase
MRNKETLDSLFPRVRQRVLAATLTHPDQWWYMSQLASFLGTTPSSLQRELSSLVASGILQRREEGNRVYFKAETRSPLFADLKRLMEKTAGVVPSLRTALTPFDEKIVCAFVYGSFARREEHALSDVDLMVIGSLGLAELSPVLRKLERRLNREVNVTTCPVKEIRNRISARDHFFRELLSGPKHFVKGGQRELDTIIG